MTPWHPNPWISFLSHRIVVNELAMITTLRISLLILVEGVDYDALLCGVVGWKCFISIVTHKSSMQQKHRCSYSGPCKTENCMPCARLEKFKFFVIFLGLEWHVGLSTITPRAPSVQIKRYVVRAQALHATSPPAQLPAAMFPAPGAVMIATHLDI